MRLACEMGQGVRERAFQIVQTRFSLQQRQTPAQLMGDAGTVVPSIGHRDDRRQSRVLDILQNAAIPLLIARDPVLLKPGEMTQFPERRIKLLL